MLVGKLAIHHIIGKGYLVLYLKGSGILHYFHFDLTPIQRRRARGDAPYLEPNL